MNQDAILFRYSERDGQHFAILAVCDGVGGLEKGEVASALVVRKINEWYDEVLRWLDIASAEPEVLNAHLKDGAELWNQAVCECRDIQRVNMGTTMSLLMIIKDRYFIIQVGDSRVYCGSLPPQGVWRTGICFWCVPTGCIIVWGWKM